MTNHPFPYFAMDGYSSDSTDASCGPGPLADALDAVCDRLLQAMHADGFWEGRLSSSALSTATALSALALGNDPGDTDRIGSGMAWLAGSQNADGGWGDTPDSPSNLATTLLAIAAMSLVMANEETGVGSDVGRIGNPSGNEADFSDG